VGPKARLGGSQSRARQSGEEKKLAVPGIEFRSFSSYSGHYTELSRKETAREERGKTELCITYNATKINKYVTKIFTGRTSTSAEMQLDATDMKRRLNFYVTNR
jgi:hypothetical protein